MEVHLHFLAKLHTAYSLFNYRVCCKLTCNYYDSLLHDLLENCAFQKHGFTLLVIDGLIHLDM